MESTKLNILYIATSITGGGGVARILSQKTAAFVEDGHQVKIASTNDRSTKPFYAFDSRVSFVLYDQPIRRINQVKRYYAFIESALISTFKPDVIFVIDNGIKGYFASYFLHTKTPLYFEVHGSRNFLLAPISSKLKRFFVDKLTLWLSRRFTGVIVLNEQSKSDWKHQHMTVIPNWIDVQASPLPTTALKKKQCIAIGRLVPEKNYEMMLAIWNKLHVKFPYWKLVICGTGAPEYVAELKALAGPGVIWKGEITGVEQVIQESSFMLHTSKMEGMPMAFLEAMALGVPIVAFDVDFGPADLIEHGKTGYLLPFGNEELMAHCCLIFMTNPDVVQSFGQQAIHAVKRYGKAVVLAQWMHFLKGLK